MSLDMRDSSGGSLSRVIVVGLICAFAQITVAPNVGVLQGHANFALVFTACVAMSEGGDNAVLAGFFSGLFYDLCGDGPLGLMALELTVAGYLLGLSGRNRFAEERLELARAYLLTTLAAQLAYQTVMLVMGQSSSFLEAIAFRMLPSMLLDCVAFLPFALWFSRQVVAGSSLGFGNRKARHGRFDTPGK